LHSRVPFRLVPFALAVVAVTVVTSLPALPVAADTEPPFEIAFPQDTSKTYFDDTYGDHRSGGRSHKGNDLLAPRMTEVYAAADGIVIHVGTSRLSGRNLRIEHEGGWTSHYVHLNNDNIGADDGDAPWTLTLAPGVELGREVVKGQLIAWVRVPSLGLPRTLGTLGQSRPGRSGRDPVDRGGDSTGRSACSPPLIAGDSHQVCQVNSGP